MGALRAGKMDLDAGLAHAKAGEAGLRPGPVYWACWITRLTKSPEAPADHLS